jgi:hypothetical protein
MADEEGGIKFTFLDLAEKVLGIALHVRLPRAHLQSLLHEGAERKFVEIPP